MKDYRLEVASLMGEVQSLAYMVNEFTDYCVFVRFSGHVKGLEVDISPSKQRYNDKCTSDSLYIRRSKYWESESEDEAMFKKLRAIKTGLRKILRNHNINYDRLNYTVEEVRHYKLT